MKHQKQLLALKECFDKSRSLDLVRKAAKRNGGGLLSNLMALHFAVWYGLAFYLSALGQIGPILAMPLVIIFEPLIVIVSFWLWIFPEHRNKKHLEKKATELAVSISWWWYHRVWRAMQKRDDGILMLDENLLPPGTEYKGWELAGYTTEEVEEIVTIFAAGVKKRLSGPPYHIEIPDVPYRVINMVLKEEGSQFVIRGEYDHKSAKQRTENEAKLSWSTLETNKR